MKNLKTSAILALSIILVFAMGTMVFAADLPSATVTEVTGAGLNITLGGSPYTMAKAVTFSTNYTDDALKASDLANFGDWICDFKVTITSPDGNGIDSDKVIFVGKYEGYDYTALPLSGTIADGAYDVLYVTGLDEKLTYKEVVNNVGSFTCGIIDKGLPAGTDINVQFVMYEDETRATANSVGAPVVFDSVPSSGLPSAVVTEITGDALNTPLGTMERGVVFSTNYTDEALKARDLADFGDWICDFKVTMTSPDGNGIFADSVTLVGKYEGYDYTALPLSGVIADGAYDVLYVTGLDDKLTYRDVVNNVGSFTCGIIDNGLPIGTVIDVQLVMYEDDSRTVIHNIGNPIVFEKFNLKISGKDAYIGDDGLGYLRFITKVGTTGVTAFGTWIVPEDFLTDGYDNAAKLSKDESIAKGYEFTADILGIPASYLTKTFYAKSFITTGDVTEWTNATTAVVEDDKNYTSN